MSCSQSKLFSSRHFLQIRQLPRWDFDLLNTSIDCFQDKKMMKTIATFFESFQDGPFLHGGRQTPGEAMRHESTSCASFRNVLRVKSEKATVQCQKTRHCIR